jgi:hypothetical protein
MSEKKKAELKAENKDTTAEERALSRDREAPGRHSGAWEVDAEANRARAASARVDAAEAEARKARVGTPEVPGADTYTHGGSGEPPSMDPEVKALLESGKPLEVGGDNKLREKRVEPS